jgi:hypothetical protein
MAKKTFVFAVACAAKIQESKDETYINRSDVTLSFYLHCKYWRNKV